MFYVFEYTDLFLRILRHVVIVCLYYAGLMPDVMLSDTYYAKNYACIIGQGRSTKLQMIDELLSSSSLGRKASPIKLHKPLLEKSICFPNKPFTEMQIARGKAGSLIMTDLKVFLFFIHPSRPQYMGGAWK